MMKLVLVAVTFIVISIGTCHGFPEGLEDSNSTGEPQLPTDGTWARVNSDSEDYHLRDGNDIVPHDNEDQPIEDMVAVKERELRTGNSSDTEILKLLKEIQKSQDSKLAGFSAAIANISSKLGSLRGGCPEGLFHYAPSDQCFLYMNDTTRTWCDADNACRARGLVLAHPHDPLGIRNYINSRYGDGSYVWLGAKSKDSCVKFQDTNRCIGSSNILWYYRTTSISYCLGLTMHSSGWKSYPYRTYYSLNCFSKYVALCEMAN